MQTIKKHATRCNWPCRLLSGAASCACTNKVAAQSVEEPLQILFRLREAKNAPHRATGTKQCSGRNSLLMLKRPARNVAGDCPAAGVAARTNCPVVLSRRIGSAGEAQSKWRAEVCETEQRSATKTYRRPADQKLSFINHSKCIARICLLFSSRIESLPYYLLDKPTNGLQKNGCTFVDPGDEWRESD